MFVCRLYLIAPVGAIKSAHTYKKLKILNPFYFYKMDSVYNISTIANYNAILSSMIMFSLIALYVFGCMTSARYYIFMRDGLIIRERSESTEV